MCLCDEEGELGVGKKMLRSEDWEFEEDLPTEGRDLPNRTWRLHVSKALIALFHEP